MNISEAKVLFTVRSHQECQGLEGHFDVFLQHVEFKSPDPTAIQFLVESADEETVRVIPDVPTASITLNDVKSVKVGDNHDLFFTIAVTNESGVIAEYKFVLSENEGPTNGME